MIETNIERESRKSMLAAQHEDEVNQSRRKKTEFKPALLCFKIDLALYPTCGGMLGKYIYNYIIRLFEHHMGEFPQTCRTLLEKQGRTHKRCTLMDPHTWPCKSRTTSTNIHSAAMWGYGMLSWRPAVLPAQHDDDDIYIYIYKQQGIDLTSLV